MGLTFCILIGPASIGLLSPGILEYLLQSLVSVLDSFLCIHTQQLSLIIIIIEKSQGYVWSILVRRVVESRDSREPAGPPSVEVTRSRRARH